MMPNSTPLRKTGTSKIRLTIICAKNLSKKEFFRLPDPFVKISVSGSSSNCLVTEIAKATLDPTWNQHFDLFLGIKDGITISVWNKRKVHKKDGSGAFLGSVLLTPTLINQLKDTGYQRIELGRNSNPLHPLEDLSMMGDVRGQLVVSLMSRDNTNKTSSPSGSNGVEGSSSSSSSSSQSSILTLTNSNLIRGPDDLPQGWEERRTMTNRVYYVDHNNRSTHWERPKITSPSTPNNKDASTSVSSPSRNNLNYSAGNIVLSNPSASLAPSNGSAAGTQPTTPSSSDRSNRRTPRSRRSNGTSSTSGSSSHHSTPNGGPAAYPEGENNNSDDVASGSQRKKSARHRNYLTRNRLHDQPTDLPPHFELRTTVQGQVYYYDIQNGTSTWHDPRIPRDLGQLNDQDLGALPAGWEVRYTSSGRSYYLNHLSRTTQFTDPRLSNRNVLNNILRNHKLKSSPQTTPLVPSSSPSDSSPSQSVPPPTTTSDNQLPTSSSSVPVTPSRAPPPVPSTPRSNNSSNPPSRPSTSRNTSRTSSPTTSNGGITSSELIDTLNRLESNSNIDTRSSVPASDNNIASVLQSRLDRLDLGQRVPTQSSSVTSVVPIRPTSSVTTTTNTILSSPTVSQSRNESPLPSSSSISNQPSQMVSSSSSTSTTTTTSTPSVTSNNNTSTTPSAPSLSVASSPTTITSDSDGDLPPKYTRDLVAKLAVLKAQLAIQIPQHGHCRLDVPRSEVFEESFRQINKLRPKDLKKRLMVKFRGEEGLDYGGIAREWLYLLSHEMLNPYYGLFQYSRDDIYTLQINPDSNVNPEHLAYFYFVGRVIGMSIFHGHYIDGGFAMPFYKMLLNKPIVLQDIEAVDPELYSSLNWILDNDITDVLDSTTFTVEHDRFGVLQRRELKPGGAKINLTEDNKKEYVRLYVNLRFMQGIERQFSALQKGFSELIPQQLLATFDERELELIIGGLGKIDVEDWKSNTRLKHCTSETPIVMWFWEIVNSYSEEMRARLLQFVTGSSRVPLQGFKALQGSTGAAGPRLFTIHQIDANKENLPKAHTCFNRIDVPDYESYSKMYEKLTQAVEETCGFAVE